MTIQTLLDSKPRIDLGGTSSKNLSVEGGFIRPIYKVSNSITETSSKVREPKPYNKAINKRIHRNTWHGVVDEE